MDLAYVRDAARVPPGWLLLIRAYSLLLAAPLSYTQDGLRCDLEQRSTLGTTTIN
jgi:hypothetical protein